MYIVVQYIYTCSRFIYRWWKTGTRYWTVWFTDIQTPSIHISKNEKNKKRILFRKKFSEKWTRISSLGHSTLNCRTYFGERSTLRIQGSSLSSVTNFRRRDMISKFVCEKFQKSQMKFFDDEETNSVRVNYSFIIIIQWRNLRNTHGFDNVSRILTDNWLTLANLQVKFIIIKLIRMLNCGYM